MPDLEAVLDDILHPKEPEQLKLAGWDDVVVPKAKRLVQNGAVTLLRNTPQHIMSHVIGEGTDNDGVPDEHEVEIWRRDPTNPEAIDMWSCDCAWGQRSWGRTRKWKKYNGRSCSHVLATYWMSLKTPQDLSEMEPGYQVPRGQKRPTEPGMMAPTWEQRQMQMPGMEEEGPQVTGPSESEIAIPQQPGQVEFPKQPQQAPKYPQRQQLYLWDLTSVPGQETPAQFPEMPPEQRTQTLQMPGAFSHYHKTGMGELVDPPVISVQIPRFRVVEGGFTYYSVDEFAMKIQEMQSRGEVPVVQTLRPLDLQAIGGKRPMPGAQPINVNEENTPIYQIMDLGYDPETNQRIRADESTPQGPGAPADWTTQQTCPPGKRGIIQDISPATKEILILVPLDKSPGLHPHALRGWVEYDDVKLLPGARDPYNRYP